MAYSKTQIFLHWLSAVIILWATFSGFYVALADVPDTIKHAVSFFNVSITTVLIPFFAVRMYLAFSKVRGIPRQPAELAAFVAHKAIYLATTAVLVTGVLMMDRDINVFHLFSIPQPITDPELTGRFNTAHKYACVVLGGLLVLHVAAVVKHHLCGNPVLRRMGVTTWRRAVPATQKDGAPATTAR